MKIVVVSDWFSEKMGYAENFLPKALASLGAEVHVITSNVQPYFNSPMYAETYEPFIGPPVVNCGTKELDGFTLHRLPYGFWRGRFRITGLYNIIREIKPQIVQTFDVRSFSTYELALMKPKFGYKLFQESHIHASVFSPEKLEKGLRNRFRWLVYSVILRRYVSFISEKCYPISSDAADIITDFFFFDASKIDICSLGVDIDLFTPIENTLHFEERQQRRQELRFEPNEIVCIYTGRLTEDKGPLILAKAIAHLVQQGYPFRGLFVGSGPQMNIEAIKACPGCVVHPFVLPRDLPKFYRAGDIGVWPKQESTSQLDAAACGLPLILSDRIQVLERMDGNGLLYKEGDAIHLAQQLYKLSDASVRQVMSTRGIQKVRERFSWKQIAAERIKDYKDVLRG